MEPTPPATPDLFDADTRETDLIKATRNMVMKNRLTGQLAKAPAPVAHRPPQQIDMFVAQLLDANIKDDQASMGAPIFSLSTKPDLSIWQWESVDKRHRVQVIPSVLGRATMHDKDLLIYVTSVMVHAMEAAINDGEPMPGRNVQFRAIDFINSTGRAPDGRTYAALELTLKRLKGTNLHTNIAIDFEDNAVEKVKGFGLIEDYTYVKSADETINNTTSISIVLSKWLYTALQHREVLTLHSDYWELRKPLEKRLYELFRKHCGKQDQWLVSAETLHSASGSAATLKRFKSMMVDIVAEDRLPEYRIVATTTAGGDKAYKAYRRQVFTMQPLVRRTRKNAK